MNDVQLEFMMSKKMTPSSSKLKLMNGIPQIPIIVSQEQPTLLEFLFFQIDWVN
jgi:hypothetical protein